MIACAGPFTLHGAPVIEAAARTGTHYLDTTGEQPFIRDSFDRWGPIAADSGAALVSGFGFDYVPGDMLAALTAEGLGRIDEMTIAYSVHGLGVTRGTALSALEMIKGGDVEWRGGRLQPGSMRARARRLPVSRSDRRASESAGTPRASRSRFPGTSTSARSGP